MTPFDAWMRKSATAHPTAFDSRTTPDVDTQGSPVDPRPVRRHPMPQLEHATTQDEDDKDIKEPLTRGSSDGGGCETI